MLISKKVLNKRDIQAEIFIQWICDTKIENLMPVFIPRPFYSHQLTGNGE